MELALQVVGLKMTGKLEDAKSVAMRIVGPAGDSSADSNSNNTMSFVSNALALDLNTLLHGRSFGQELERLVIKLLSLLDVNMGTSSHSVSLASAISHQTQSGQTLLHVAAFLRYPALIKFLVMHEIDLDVRDRNGYTALHVAGFVGAKECAKVLIQAGADVEIVDALGKTAQEIASFDLDDLDHIGDEQLPVEEDVDEDESRWGDAEEESEEEIHIRPRNSVVRRTGRLVRREVDPLTSEPSDSDVVTKSKPNAEIAATTTSLDGKALPPPPAIVDEKQAASFLETIHRTLARVQATQQGLMPHLPLPHLPNMPGVPWAALNNIPMVFPVYVPWPASFRGDGKREGVVEGVAPEGLDQSPKGSIRALASPQEWRAFWEKWTMQGLLMQQRAVGAEAPTYDPPPMYTPRSTDETGAPAESSGQSKAALVEDSPEETLPVAGPSNVAAVPERLTASRRPEYETVKLTDQEVNAYGYRPAKPQARQLQKKGNANSLLVLIV